jgi:hypothetical protein
MVMQSYLDAMLMRYRGASFQIIRACIPEFTGLRSLADGEDFMDLYLFWYDSA